MATFTGTPGRDVFLGADFVSDLFRFDPRHLSRSDRLLGGLGGEDDELRFIAPGEITGGMLSGARGIELITLHFGGDNRLTLLDSFVSTATARSVTVKADSGDDTVDGSRLTGRNRIVVDGGTGDDDLRGGASDDRLSGGRENDTLFGNGGDNRLDGGAEDDLLIAGRGRDVLIGGDGEDTISFSSGKEFVTAGAVNGTTGLDTVLLEDDGFYEFTAKFKNIDVIELARDARNYHLIISNAAAAGADPNPGGLIVDFAAEFTHGVSIDASRLKATSGLRIGEFAGDPTNNGDDRILGGDGNDTLLGQGGDDRLEGGGGRDIIGGGDGRDLIAGGAGIDRMSDTGGGAVFIIDRESDYVARDALGNVVERDQIFGSGERLTTDRLDLREGDVDYDLSGIVGIDQVLVDNAGGEIGIIAGATGGDANQDGFLNDLLITSRRPVSGYVLVKTPEGGGDPALVVDGRLFDGHDGLYGGGLTDSLSSGAGSDELIGGLEADTLKGGSGGDLYGFEHQLDSIEQRGAFDTILGFDAQDKIDLRSLTLPSGFTGLVVKKQGPFVSDPTLNPIAGFFQKDGQYRGLAVQTDGVNTRVYVDVDGDRAYAPNGTLFTLPDMMIEFKGNVVQFLRNAENDYEF